MKKVSLVTLVAGLLRRNVKETVIPFVSQHEAYSVMSPIKETPTYWKKFMNDVMAMVK